MKQIDEYADLNHTGISVSPSKLTPSVDSPNQVDHNLDLKQRLVSEINASHKDTTKIKHSHES